MVKIKTTSQLRKQLVLIFNKFIRLRDRNLKCISCGVRPAQQAGHFYSVAQCPKPSMRFNEKNVNGQCIRCNKWLSGNVQGYRLGLQKKYGLGVITELDVKKSVKTNPWTVFEYQQMIELYKDKVRELEDAAY